MEDAVTQPNRRFAIAKRIPSQTKPRLPFVRIARKDLAPGIPSGGLEGDWRRIPGVLVQEIRYLAIALEGDTIIGVAQPKLQRQVGTKLPGVLEKETVFMLHKPLVVCGYPLAVCIVKLRLGSGTRHSEEPGRHGLQVFVIASSTTDNRDVEGAER